MQPEHVARRLKEFEAICRRRGLPLTVQRRLILQTVLESDDHPAAEQVLESVRQRVPGVSRTTVYRVLDTLVDLGVIRRLHHPGATVRFDGRTCRHHHLICKVCNHVADFESAKLDRIALPDVQSLGFQIDDFSVQFIGTCAACRQGDAP